MAWRAAFLADLVLAICSRTPVCSWARLRSRSGRARRTLKPAPDKTSTTRVAPRVYVAAFSTGAALRGAVRPGSTPAPGAMGAALLMREVGLALLHEGGHSLLLVGQGE